MSVVRRINLAAGLVLVLVCAAASGADVGAIVMHGKWGSPERNVNGVAEALEREGLLVVSPEMPWSRRRLYDKSVEETDAEIDAQVAALRARGAKRVFLVGHSLGAAYALHYAGRSAVDGVVAIAPGHRPENPRIAQALSSDVQKARDLVGAGKGNEIVTFTDFNSGNRQDRLTARAVSFLSYFDPGGPMNMGRNVTSVRQEVPVLWLVPMREEGPLRNGGLQLFKQFPQNPQTRLAEPEADHVGAPQTSIPIVLEWIRAVAGARSYEKK